MIATEVATSLIAGMSSVLVAIVGFYAYKQKSFVGQAKKELVVQGKALDFAEFIRDWSYFYAELDKLMNETNLDRFMILRAHNGYHDPKWTTAVFQVRQGEQEAISYVHFELDSDYIDRLNETKRKRGLYFVVNDIDDSAIKGVYRAEGVEASFWAHIETVKTGKKSASTTYCSFSTHDENGFSDECITRFKILVGNLKGVAIGFGSGGEDDDAENE